MYGFNVGVDMSYSKVLDTLYKGATVYASRSKRHIDILPTEDFAGSFIGVIPNNDQELDQALQIADDYLTKIDTHVTPIVPEAPAIPEIPKIDVLPVIPVTSTANYDFASLYGLSVDKELSDGGLENSVHTSAPNPVTDTHESSAVAQIDESSKVSDVTLDPVTEAHEPSAVVQKSTPDVSQTAPMSSTSNPLPDAHAPSDVSHKITPSEPQSTPRVETRPAVNSSVQQTPTQAAPPNISGMTLLGQAQAIAEWQGKSLMSEEVLFGALGKSVVMNLVGEGYLVRTKKGILLGS